MLPNSSYDLVYTNKNRFSNDFCHFRFCSQTLSDKYTFTEMA